MAVNEKVVYATKHTTHAGVVYRPGEQMTGRAPEHAIQGALEQGIASHSHAEAERAKGAEQERQRQVAADQQRRSIARQPEDRGELR